MDNVAVAIKPVQFPADCHIPETGRLILTSRRQGFAVRRKGKRAHHAFMALESAHFLARCNVPEKHLVPRAGGHCPAVRQEGDGPGSTHECSRRTSRYNAPLSSWANCRKRKPDSVFASATS